MQLQYKWKTKLFSNRFEILEHDRFIGELKKEGLSKKVKGELNSRGVRFETIGIFKSETNIIDLQGELTVGQIKYKNWKSKSTIFYQNKEYRWQFDNFLGSKWSISNENGAMIKYHSHALTGTITSYTRDEILILAGFFIRNFLKQRSAGIAAAT